MTALQTYERVVGLADAAPDGYYAWDYLASILRAEAARYSDQRAQECVDRAEDCEYRARKVRS